MNIFKKIIFLITRPCIILITGEGRICALEAVLTFKRKKVLIFESDLSKEKEIKRFKFLLRNSRLPILVATRIGEIPPDKFFFSGDKDKTFQIRKLAEVLPRHGFLILNFDDETIREMEKETETKANSITYGFQERANLKASDININLDGTNFKINYQGKIIPFWIKKLFGKEQIYTALVVASVGIAKDINLVKASQALNSYQSLPGKMRLIEGVKKSWILDDSESATAFSMIEALKILGGIKIEGRKIAVLGDILGIGKYTIEAHETIGEKTAKTADLLFTVGARAKFIAQGAKTRGMPGENIFQFDTVKEAKIAIQREMKKDDLILIDGSREMKMSEIVEEIKNIKI